MSSFFFKFFSGALRKKQATIRMRVVSWNDLEKNLKVSILESRPRVCKARIVSLIEEEGLRFVVLGFSRGDGQEEFRAFPWEKVLVVEEGK